MLQFPTTPVHITTIAVGDKVNNDTYRVPLTIWICLSMFGCVVIITTYFLFNDLRTTPRKILVFMSIGDFLTVFPYLLSIWGHPESVTEAKYCKTQSFITSTAVMWSFMWTSSLSIYLYIFLVKKRSDVAEKLMLPFNIINWGAPLAINELALGFDVLGNADGKNTGGWCWIKNQDQHLRHHWQAVLWMLACGKLCEIISYLINCICYFFVTRKIKKEVREQHYCLTGQSIQSAIQGQRKLALAPVLFVLLRIWGTIRFIMDCFKIEDKLSDPARTFFFVCHMFGDTSQGFVNFLLFCVFTKKFRDVIRRACECQGPSAQEETNSLFTRSNESIAEHKYILKDPGPITFYT